MNDVERKLLWRNKKRAAKDLFKAHGIKSWKQSIPQELIQDLFGIGFSMISYYESIDNQLINREFNKCDGPRKCEACENQDAIDISYVYMDELQEPLSLDQIENNRWLHLRIDYQNWGQNDFNFIVEPMPFAHRK
jgi:hypothetical protein